MRQGSENILREINSVWTSETRFKFDKFDLHLTNPDVKGSNINLGKKRMIIYKWAWITKLTVGLHCKNYYKTEKYFNIAVGSSDDYLERFL